MASRVTGNHIPRNMNRVLPSADPAITFLDEALCQGLRTLGFAFRHNRYHPVEDTSGVPVTEAERKRFPAFVPSSPPACPAWLVVT
jgi:hypothetical protein